MRYDEGLSVLGDARARLAQGRLRPRAPRRSAAGRPAARPAPRLAGGADRGGAGGAGGVRAGNAGEVSGTGVRLAFNPLPHSITIPFLPSIVGI